MLKLTGLNPVKETEGLMGACSGKKKKKRKKDGDTKTDQNRCKTTKKQKTKGENRTTAAPVGLISH